MTRGNQSNGGVAAAGGNGPSTVFGPGKFTARVVDRDEARETGGGRHATSEAGQRGLGNKEVLSISLSLSRSIRRGGTDRGGEIRSSSNAKAPLGRRRSRRASPLWYFITPARRSGMRRCSRNICRRSTKTTEPSSVGITIRGGRGPAGILRDPALSAPPGRTLVALIKSYTHTLSLHIGRRLSLSLLSPFYHASPSTTPSCLFLVSSRSLCVRRRRGASIPARADSARGIADGNPTRCSPGLCSRRRGPRESEPSGSDDGPTGARGRLVLTDYRYAVARSRYRTWAGNRTFRTGSAPRARIKVHSAGRDPLSPRNGCATETAVNNAPRRRWRRKSRSHLGDFIARLLSCA